MVSLINFDTAPNLPGTPGFNPALPVTPGFFTGWSVVTHTFELTDADPPRLPGTNEFYKADGNAVTDRGARQRWRRDSVSAKPAVRSRKQ